jgi:hypothetical protein
VLRLASALRHPTPARPMSITKRRSAAEGPDTSLRVLAATWSGRGQVQGVRARAPERAKGVAHRSGAEEEDGRAARVYRGCEVLIMLTARDIAIGGNTAQLCVALAEWTTGTSSHLLMACIALSRSMVAQRTAGIESMRRTVAARPRSLRCRAVVSSCDERGLVPRTMHGVGTHASIPGTPPPPPLELDRRMVLGRRSEMEFHPRCR